jgi:hypothetical protein
MNRKVTIVLFELEPTIVEQVLHGIEPIIGDNQENVKLMLEKLLAPGDIEEIK